MALSTPDRPSLQLCPKRPWLLVCDQQPGLRVPASCDSYACNVCGPRKATATADLVAWGARNAGDARLFTGTLAPVQWQARRQKVRDLGRILRRRGHQWECAWVAEPNGRAGMFHVHGLQHGDNIPSDELTSIWGARVELKPVTALEITRTARYLVKETRAGAARHQSFLDINGGRALHWSAGFFPGTRRQAEQALRVERAASADSHLTWHSEPS